MLNVNNNFNTNNNYIRFKQVPSCGVAKCVDTEKKDTNKKTAITSCATSVAMILLTLFELKHHKISKGAKNIRMFNMKLNEMDILALGTSTVIGAFLGGIITDKPEHKKAKLREGCHQIIGNIATPMLTIWGCNKVMDKLNIKIPKMKSSGKFSKVINVAAEIFPNFVSSCIGLWSGIQIGNKISNKVTDNVFGKKVKVRPVKIVDYCVHIDDPLTLITLADKSGKLKAFTCKTMPFTFILSGYQVGMAQNGE